VTTTPETSGPPDTPEHFPETAFAAETAVVSQRPPISLFRRRLSKFRSIRRGYYSFLLILAAYAFSFLLPLLVNNTAWIVHYQGRTYFPMLRYYPASTFGQQSFGEPDYRALRRTLREQDQGNWVLMPPYPYSATESILDLPGSPPHAPSWQHIFGTDDRGRDIFARLAYGFNVSLTFSLLVLVFGYAIGVTAGAALGYYGGKLDILGVRVIEIWSSLPFLYVIMIVSSIIVPVYIPGRNLVLQPSFWLLIFILSIFDWMGITYYVRGEFYREKAKDYVGAAISMGASDRSIIFRHILPNSLTSAISFAPFVIVGNISALVALDFLGFGLPAPTPSWGELIGQGMENLTKWWLVFFPLAAMFITLLLIVFIGEAVREAFDPKEYSRLR
jgi:microcin C transport system permease protein